MENKIELDLFGR